MACVICPLANAPVIAGKAKEAKIAMIEITTSSSMSVKAVSLLISFIFLRVESVGNLAKKTIHTHYLSPQVQQILSNLFATSSTFARLLKAEIRK